MECLRLETMEDFLAGRLRESEQAALLEHLETCRACLESLAGAAAVFNDESLQTWTALNAAETRTAMDALGLSVARERAEPFLSRVAYAFDRFARSAIALWRGPAFSRARTAAPDASNARVWEKKFGACAVKFYIGSPDADHFDFSVERTSGQEGGWADRITLVRRDGAAVSLPLDDSGAFGERIPMGAYRLILSENEKEIENWAFVADHTGIHET